MEQDQASQPFHRSPQGKNRRAERKQNRSLPHMPSKRFHLRYPQHRGSTRDLGRRRRRSPPYRPNAHFPGWFPLIASGFWRVVFRWWNVLIVPRRVPSNPMVRSCGSSRTTNAKRGLPILDNDGPGGKQTGMLSAVEVSIYRMLVKKPRCDVVCQDTLVRVLIIKGKCLYLRAKFAHLAGHLPPLSRLGGNLAEDSTESVPMIELFAEDSTKNTWSASK